MTMTLLNPSNTDIGFTQKACYPIEKLATTKTPSGTVCINKDESDSIKTMYAYNPITKTLVEIDPTQAWFWQPDWLNSELEVNQELSSGNFEEFDDLDALIDSL